MTDETPSDGCPPETRTHALIHSCRDVLRAWTDPSVDIAAVLALAWVVQHAPTEATMQILAAAISSVAVGKRWIRAK